ncbi:MAG: hypothetical protein GTO02_05775 [Candidatus Dadabacteria bacterium]|nr:hypothetical protein [Candidatus Dadabacteria bacterium]
MTTNILWVTSFNKEIYEASGGRLLSSFVDKQVEGDIFIGFEGECYLQSYDRFHVFNLDDSKFLQDWLTVNADIAPPKPCRCPDPWAGPCRKHVPKCPHTWFNRNTHRWFRKWATLRHALDMAKNVYNRMIWIDADCRFISRLSEQAIDKTVFRADTEKECDVAYLKHKRRVLEGGFVAYNIGCCHIRGIQLLEKIFKIYTSGEFRNYIRWDDCYVLQKAMRGFRCHDLAKVVDQRNHEEVFSGSKIGHYIRHDKGRHGRVLGIMK